MSRDQSISRVGAFDSLRQQDVLGDWWSARTLQGALGYVEWRKFEDAIERAQAAITNSGMRAADHIGAADKMTEIGKGAMRLVADYRLTKYGAYMVAMNGDPRKPEIAAAQTYFAVQTHRAETALPQFDPTSMDGVAVILAAANTAMAKVRELAPLAAHAETFRQAEGLRTIADVANDFKVHCATHFPSVKVRHQDIYDHAGRLGIIIRGDTVRRNEPTAQAVEAGWVKPHRAEYETNTRGIQSTVSARLTPKGEGRLWDGLCAWVGARGSLALLRQP
ncbi:MAG: hypothetical protein JWP32_2885 [Schumannella sp.]|nr:hypothetical protein [Schumannella sp.]